MPRFIVGPLLARAVLSCALVPVRFFRRADATPSLRDEILAHEQGRVRRQDPVRSAIRDHRGPEFQNFILGFRCAQTR